MEERKIHTTSDGAILRWKPNLPLRLWWIFTFIVSLLIFSSALIFLGREADAKPGGGNLNLGDLASGGSGSQGHANPGGRGPGGGGGSGGDSLIGGGASNRQPVQQQVHRAADSTLQPARDMTSDARRPADTVLNTVNQPTNGVQKQLNEATQPVLNTVEQTANNAQKRLSETTQPVLKDVQDQLNQTTQPILNTAEQALAPENQPAKQTLDSVEQTQPPTQQTSEPLVTSIQQPPSTPSVLHEETSLPVAPALEESVVQSDSRSLLPQVIDTPALQSVTSSPAPETPKNTSFVLSGFTSTTPESLRSSSVQPSVERKQAAPVSMSEHSGVKDSAAGTQSISAEAPQPSPIDALPESLSAGFGSTFGGSGFGVGILAFLAMLLLGGGSLWSRRDSLAPDSAPHLILERPG